VRRLVSGVDLLSWLGGRSEEAAGKRCPRSGANKELPATPWWSVPVTDMPRESAAEVLACLEDEFADFAAAFARGEYLMWLGSGISRDVVPGVPQLLEQMLEFLRAEADPNDRECRFSRALGEVLDVAGVNSSVRTSIDLTTPVGTWPQRSDIVDRLVSSYADVLDVQVDGEAEDFLVWTGLNVPTVYGAPSLLPDVEHLCVAILMLEGVVRSAPTTNWDGLVEAAVQELGADIDHVLNVVVEPLDFRRPERRAELVKFHGCAVRAAANEEEYRPRLIARKSQISGWTTKPENQLMKNRLEHLFASRPAFVVGLSAQDADIHTIWHQANQGLARTWPTSPPAIVLAEQTLSNHHRHVLRVTYGASYAAHANEVAGSALLGAYAKPALVGLTLYTLADKLCVLAGAAPDLSLSETDLDQVCANIRSLRDALGSLPGAETRAFVEALASGIALALSIFRSGRVPGLSSAYQPISSLPISAAQQDPDFPTAAFGRFALAMSMLGRGHREGRWQLATGALAAPDRGVVRVIAALGETRLFIVRDARATSHLETEGLISSDDADVLVLLAEAPQAAATRSPRRIFGRTGRRGARHVDLEELCASVATADELFEALILEAVL
jgi:hypothetical protein